VQGIHFLQMSEIQRHVQIAQQEELRPCQIPRPGSDYFLTPHLYTMVVHSSLLLASLAFGSTAFNPLPRNPGSSHSALTQRKASLLQHLARQGRVTTQTIKNNSVKPPTISCHQILIVHWGFWFGDFLIVVPPASISESTPDLAMLF
jgi:hypothetical protein